MQIFKYHMQICFKYSQIDILLKYIEYGEEPATNAVEDDVNSSPIRPFLNGSLELLLSVVHLIGDDDDDDDDDDNDESVVSDRPLFQLQV